MQECAYEHWHRMLFARFLAENGPARSSRNPAWPITLDEVQELAREKATDWLALASDYRRADAAADLPPGRSGARDRAAAGERGRSWRTCSKGLPRAVFDADDSLGWVYQFWQAEQEGRGQQVRGEDRRGRAAGGHAALHRGLHGPLPAPQHARRVVGRQGAGREARAGDVGATSEDELRAACERRRHRLDLSALRPRQPKTERRAWRPAAGTFEGWPKAAKDFTVLDPCMGSGHFLVFALPILVAFRTRRKGSLCREPSPSRC